MEAIKLFANRIGDAGACAIADWLIDAGKRWRTAVKADPRGAANSGRHSVLLCKELHLSDNCLTRPGLVALAIGLIRAGCYPIVNSKKTKVSPLWIRVENNYIFDLATGGE